MLTPLRSSLREFSESEHITVEKMWGPPRRVVHVPGGAAPAGGGDGTAPAAPSDPIEGAGKVPKTEPML